MSCPACGADVVSDDRFCHACGVPVATVEPVPSPTQPAPSLPVSEAGHERRFPYLPAYPGGPVERAAPAPPIGSAGAWGSRGPYAPFGAPLARWWQRVGAMLLDWLILGLPSLLLGLFVPTATARTQVVLVHGRLMAERVVPGAVTVTLFVGLTVAGACYFAVFNGTGRGQTPGNRAPDIAVRDARTGEPIGFWRGVLRWLVRFLLYSAFVLPGLVNDLFPLWNARRQTLADMAARSVMIARS